MPLDRLIIFAAVARHRNFSRASRELHISQPAVTNQIKLLEKEYSTTLFNRGGRGVQLTDRGKAFLRDVSRLVKQYERLKEKFGAVSSKSPVQALRVGGSYSPSASLLPSLLARFEKIRPNVLLDLHTDNRRAVERKILRGEVELAVINNPAVTRRLTMEPYREESVVAFVRSDHPLAKKRCANLEELGGFGFVIRRHLAGKATTKQYLEHLVRQGLRPKVVLRCDTPEGVKEAVRNKLGVGILFRGVVERNINRGEFKVVKLPVKNLSGQSFIVYRKDKSISPVAQEFLDLLRRHRPAHQRSRT